MRLRPNVLGGVAANPVTEDWRGGTQASSPALIGMSLRQDIPGGLLSSRARFRFSCQDHSETKDSRRQQNRSEQRSVPTSRVSKLDTAQPWTALSLVTELVTVALDCPRLPRQFGDRFGDADPSSAGASQILASYHAGFSMVFGFSSVKSISSQG